MAVDERIRGIAYDAVDMGVRTVETGLKGVLGALNLLRTVAEGVLGSPQPGVPAARRGEPVPAEPPRRPPRREPPPAEPPEPAHVD